MLKAIMGKLLYVFNRSCLDRIASAANSQLIFSNVARPYVPRPDRPDPDKPPPITGNCSDTSRSGVYFFANDETGDVRILLMARMDAADGWRLNLPRDDGDETLIGCQVLPRVWSLFLPYTER